MISMAVRRRLPLTALLSCGTLLAVGPSSATQLQRTSPSTTDPTIGVAAVNAMDDLTPQTDAERAQARFFDIFGGKDLLGPGDVRIVPSESLPPPTTIRPTYRSFLEAVLCAGRVIVVGRVQPQRVRLNFSRSYLFTEYLLGVTTWISPLDRAHPDTVALLVPGGEVLVNGRITATSGVKLVATNALSVVPDRMFPALTASLSLAQR